MTPYVSVILPTYNRGHVIQTAIQSVLNQSYKNFEILVVDDGSTDNTPEQITRVQDRRLQYIRQDLNQGAAAARNVGMKAAQGSYIAFLDSDDAWHPDKLRQQLEFLETAPSNVGGCVTAYRLVFPDKSVVRSIPMEQDFYQQSLKGCNLSPGSTLMFRRACLDQVGGQNENLKRFEDWEWQICFSRFYAWHKLPQVLADIRAGHTVAFNIAQHALQQSEETLQNIPKADKKTIKVAIAYELFYAACKNRLWAKAFAYLLGTSTRTTLPILTRIVSIIRRKIQEFNTLT